MTRVPALVAVAVAAAVPLVGAVAQAAGPATGQIHGCYTTAGSPWGSLGPAKGTLRVVDAGAACRSGEVGLSWNEMGPQGPAGGQGPYGAAATRSARRSSETRAS